MRRIQFSLKKLLWVMATAIALCLVLRAPASEYERAVLGWLCLLLIVSAAMSE
jgi:hypothetical protein